MSALTDSEVCFGYERWWVNLNWHFVYLGTKPIGEVLKFSNGLEWKGPAILPLSNSLANLSSTILGFCLADIKVLWSTGIITTKKIFQFLPWRWRWQHLSFYLRLLVTVLFDWIDPECWPLPDWVCLTLVPCSGLPSLSIWIRDDYSPAEAAGMLKWTSCTVVPLVEFKAEFFFFGGGGGGNGRWGIWKVLFSIYV